LSTKGLAFLERMKQEIVVGDGATGTMLWSRGLPLESTLELANLDQPDLVKAVHLEYVAAGSEVVETNTFGANRFKLDAGANGDRVHEINAAAVRLARSVVPDHVIVAGSMGPLGRLDRVEDPDADERVAAHREQAEVLLGEGVDVLFLETFAHADELARALDAVRSLDADIPVFCQMAFTELPGGSPGSDLERALIGLVERGASAIGGNCGSGPLGLYRVVREISRRTDALLSAQPNASLPQYVNGRYIYRTDPAYFAESAEQLAQAGANLIGGCCGTTPDHIRAVVARLKGRKPEPRTIDPLPARVPRRRLRRKGPPIYSPLDRIGTTKVTLVEMKPPRGTALGAIRRAARKLKEAGADAYSLVENSLAQVRMSPFALAHVLQEEFGVACVCHCTCRDRNLMGQHSELSGAAALGIRTVLALTGDPASMGDASESTSVFDTNSLGLIELLANLNRGINVTGTEVSGAADFVIGAAFDPNVRRLEPAVRRLEKKVARGAQFAMTQPVFDAALIPEIYDRTGHLGIPVFLGVMPLVSYRNASFLHNEVPGIRLPDDVLDRMRAAPRGRAAQTGREIACELVDVGFAHAPGFYIMPQMEKYEVAADLVRHVKARTPADSGA